MLFSFLEKEKQRKRKIPFSARPMRASVVCDSRFTQIRAKAGSPSDIRRCIPIPDVQATTLAARLFQSAFGAKRLCGIRSKCMLTGKKAPLCKGSCRGATEGLLHTQSSGGSKHPPHVNPQCSHKAFFERGARIEIESDGMFGEEEKSGNI